MTETGTIPSIAPTISGGSVCAVGDGQFAACPSIKFGTYYPAPQPWQFQQIIAILIYYFYRLNCLKLLYCDL
ncbi:hypothetical protein GGI43DRAFT_410663 [Trichoderma evansii]